ncbi:MAG: YebC/PmpR family DNA-binding transcriptional regulator, partial [bacterium]|nr:YebC/PmpR family DNA-binding transcriptional regulator [bacterium]
SVAMETLTYEAYGAGGAALIIEVLTDNRNKAAQEIKFILSKHNSSLGAAHSATWAFEKTSDGWIPKTTVDLNVADSNELIKLMEELEDNDEVQGVFTNAELTV